MSYGYTLYTPVPKQRMAPADGVPHEKYEGGKGAQAYLVYTWFEEGKGYYLLVYGGRRMRPDAYRRYRTEETRDANRDEYLKRYRERAEQAEREKALANPLKVGDLLRCSWGYEQTNVDYFQVVKATKRSVTLREIAAKSVGATGPMSDRCAPEKDNFVGEPMSKRVRVYLRNGEPQVSVKIYSHAYAYPCSENETSHRSWYY